MGYIDDLRQRVEAAGLRFGAIDERNRKYGEWLIDLMTAVEASHREKLAEIDQHKTALGQLRKENEELRTMLHALLLAVEEGNRDRLTETIHQLDTKASALVGVAAGGGSLARLTARVGAAATAAATAIHVASKAPPPAVSDRLPYYTPPPPASGPLKRSLARFLGGYDREPADQLRSA